MPCMHLQYIRVNQGQIVTSWYLIVSLKALSILVKVSKSNKLFYPSTTLANDMILSYHIIVAMCPQFPSLNVWQAISTSATPKEKLAERMLNRHQNLHRCSEREDGIPTQYLPLGMAMAHIKGAHTSVHFEDQPPEKEPALVFSFEFPH